eukprot:6853276-Pyramimonas_sp.AAC.1
MPAQWCYAHTTTALDLPAAHGSGDRCASGSTPQGAAKSSLGARMTPWRWTSQKPRTWRPLRCAEGSTCREP